MANKENELCNSRCKEVKVCQKCNPVSFGEFRKVLELEKTSVAVFICNDEVSTDEQKKKKGKDKLMKTYLVYNSGEKSVDRSEYLEELNKISTQCTHCNATLKKMKVLLDREQFVKQKEIIGTCEHCRILPKPVKCKQCADLINKFLAQQVRHYEERDELYKGWMNDVNQIVSDFLIKKSVPKVYRKQTSLELKKLLREVQSPERLHEPVIKSFPGSDILETMDDTAQTCEKNISLLKKIFSILEGDKPGLKENLEKILGEQYVQEMPEELIIGLGKLTKHKMANLFGLDLTNKLIDKQLDNLGILSKEKLMKVLGPDLTKDMLDSLLINLGLLSKEKAEKTFGSTLTSDVLDKIFLTIGGDKLTMGKLQKIFGNTVPKAVYEDILIKFEKEKLNIKALEKLVGSSTVNHGLFDKALTNLGKLTTEKLKNCVGSHLSNQIENKLLANIGKLNQEKSVKIFGFPNTEKIVEKKLAHFRSQLTREKLPKLIGSDLADEVLGKIMSNVGEEKLTRENLEKVLGPNLAKEILNKIFKRVQGEKLTIEKLETLLGTDIPKDLLEKITENLEDLSVDAIDNLFDLKTSTKVANTVLKNLGKEKFLLGKIPGSDKSFEMISAFKGTRKKYYTDKKQRLSDRGSFSLVPQPDSSPEPRLSEPKNVEFTDSKRLPLPTKPPVADRSTQVEEQSLPSKKSAKTKAIQKSEEIPPAIDISKSKQQSTGDLSDESLLKQRPSRETIFTKHVDKNKMKAASEVIKLPEKGTYPEKDKKSKTKLLPSRTDKTSLAKVTKSKSQVIDSQSDKTSLTKVTKSKTLVTDSQALLKRAAKSKTQVTDSQPDKTSLTKVTKSKTLVTDSQALLKRAAKSKTQVTDSQPDKTSLTKVTKSKTLVTDSQALLKRAAKSKTDVTDTLLKSSSKIVAQNKTIDDQSNKIIVDIIQPIKEDQFDLPADLRIETKEKKPDEVLVELPPHDVRAKKKKDQKQKRIIKGKKQSRKESKDNKKVEELEGELPKDITDDDRAKLDALASKDTEPKETPKEKSLKLSSSTKELLKLLKGAEKERMLRDKERLAREKELKKIKMPIIKNLPKIPQKTHKHKDSSEISLVDHVTKPEEITEMVKGIEIVVPSKVRKLKKHVKKPLLFSTSPVFEPHTPVEKKVKLVTPPKLTLSEVFHCMESDDLKGIVRYRLSNPEFVDKGWTRLPTVRIMRRLNIYKMKPSRPAYDFFTKHKNDMLFYDSGEKLAEIDSEGYGKWYYKNGMVALDYYKAKEPNVANRYVVYSSGERDENGTPRMKTVLACFDQIGNGVVFDHWGNERLKYNQTEGVVLDEKIGPASKWKWHSLNDPMVLKPVYMDNFPRKRNIKIEELIRLAEEEPSVIELAVSQKDVKKVKLLKQAEDEKLAQQAANDEMLGIELTNYVKQKTEKLLQRFQPYEIKAKFLKINEQFSLKIIDQANIALHFRDGTNVLKQNIGLDLDYNEILDTETMDLEDVITPFDRVLPKSQSIEDLMELLQLAKSKSK